MSLRQVWTVWPILDRVWPKIDLPNTPVLVPIPGRFETSSSTPPHIVEWCNTIWPVLTLSRRWAVDSFQIHKTSPHAAPTQSKDRKLGKPLVIHTSANRGKEKDGQCCEQKKRERERESLAKDESWIRLVNKVNDRKCGSSTEYEGSYPDLPTDKGDRVHLLILRLNVGQEGWPRNGPDEKGLLCMEDWEQEIGESFKLRHSNLDKRTTYYVVPSQYLSSLQKGWKSVHDSLSRLYH